MTRRSVAANIASTLAIGAFAGWLIITYADQPGPRPAQGPPAGAIATPTAAAPR